MLTVEGWRFHAEQLAGGRFLSGPGFDYGRLSGAELFRRSGWCCVYRHPLERLEREQVVEFPSAVGRGGRPTIQSETSTGTSRYTAQALSLQAWPTHISASCASARRRDWQQFEIRGSRLDANGGTLPLDLLERYMIKWIAQEKLQ